jgi:hypothetical protein
MIRAGARKSIERPGETLIARFDEPVSKDMMLSWNCT